VENKTANPSQEESRGALAGAVSSPVDEARSPGNRPACSVALSSWPNGQYPSRKEGVLVRRSPDQLRPHRVLDEIGWTDVGELNDAARRKVQGVLEPILITHNGTILSGVGSWHLALLEGQQQISCFQYDVDENESLQYILAIHKVRSPWNSFISIRIALRLEAYFQHKALENMRAGGKHKGSTNLSKADRIEVRQEIATAAGSGVGNVDKVKAILQSAHPHIIQALQNGSLRIHRAWKWCRLPKSEQKEAFAKHDEDQTRCKILREFNTARPKTCFDSGKAFELLRSLEAAHPGEIEFCAGRNTKTVVILGRDLIKKITMAGL
jgi:hypothetical protein